MTTIIDAFRDTLPIYRELLKDAGRDPFSVLNMVDRKLAEIGNHIAVCHRVIAEHRAAAHGSLLGGSGDRTAKIDQASDSLDQVISVQGEYFDFRHEVLQCIARLCIRASTSDHS